MKKSKILKILIIIVLILLNYNIFSENVYFFTRGTFSYSQFWERNKDYYDREFSRKVVTNFFSGSIGLGLEFEIVDIGVKRGSRLFFKTGIDLVFSGIGSAAAYYDSEDNRVLNRHDVAGKTMYELDINGGAFYLGLDLDFFFGGTFPKTNFIWGFGCIWTFLFPVYAPEYNVLHFKEKFHFYATPTILFGYDLKIKNTPFKITPQMRVGFTCMPLIPDDLIRDFRGIEGNYINAEMYSGIYVDFSVAFSFATVQWKESE